ncbi:MAG: hypothetical protein GX446_16300, partial [Chthonomonadales bacterium]|nr:hypothetical protein [Chthonomonadales bacterium]
MRENGAGQAGITSDHEAGLLGPLPLARRHPLYDGRASERSVTNGNQTVTGTINVEAFGQMAGTPVPSLRAQRSNPDHFAATRSGLSGTDPHGLRRSAPRNDVWAFGQPASDTALACFCRAERLDGHVIASEAWRS